MTRGMIARPAADECCVLSRISLVASWRGWRCVAPAGLFMIVVDQWIKPCSLGGVEAVSHRRGPALEWIAVQRATDREVHQLWDSPSARETVEAYVKKTLRSQPPGSIEH